MLAGEEPLRDLLRDISVRWDALGPATISASRKSEDTRPSPSNTIVWPLFYPNPRASLG